jgi:superfamily II DNA or RNA helicase
LKKTGHDEQFVRGMLAQFMRLLKQRKAFVLSHPKKFELANKILDYRQNKKCILFSSTIKDAELFKNRACVLHSKKKKKENKELIEKFNLEKIGNISTSKSCDAGVDIKGLSVGIIISGDSSTTRMVQRTGRCIRLETNKLAEMFSLVIAGTNDELWFNNANKNQSYITITEEQLDLVLQGEEISTRPKQGPVDFDNRF